MLRWYSTILVNFVAIQYTAKMGAPSMGQMSREIFNMLITPDSDLVFKKFASKMQLLLVIGCRADAFITF